MAVPAYNTDLNTIVLCESGDSFEEFSGYALGDNAALETDWYLQGNSCASDEANGKTGVGHSIGFDYGSTITFAAGECMFAWMMCMAGNAMDLYANGGYRVLMGSSTSVFYGWYVGGSDYGRNPYGGWTNVVVDPTATPQDTGHGSPTTWQHFAVAFNLTSSISKGRPNCADAMRYGRGQLSAIDGEANELLLDSYPTTNYSNGMEFSGYYAYKGYSQTFTTGTDPGKLRKASFYMGRVGTLTGTVYSRLYATSSGAPTGTPGTILAEATRAGSGISGPLAVEDFTFSDGYQLEEDTTYAISVEYSVDEGSGNYLNLATDNSSPSHSGSCYRLSKFTSGWSITNTNDAIFYVYGESTTSGNFATFTGMAAANDVSTARWGLFQEQAGIFLWKGLMSLGTGTPVEFVDSNKNITIDDTPRTYASFNRIEISNNRSTVRWTGINITALNSAGLSIGQFEAVGDPNLDFDNCVFTDMGSFTFDSTSTNASMLSCTWRRCTTVIQGLCQFDSCVFDNSVSTSSLNVSDLDLITNCTFVSDGSNHGMELDSNHAGGSFTLDGCVFTDYASVDGSTGNECIYNNSGGSVTINVSNGAIPSIRNGSGATTTVVASVIWNFEIKNASNEIVSGSEFRIYNSGTQTQVFGVETSDGTETYPFDQSLAGSDVDVVVHTVDTYLYFRQTLARPAGNTTTTLVLAVDRWYSNPVVTKTHTWGKRPTDTWQTWQDSYMSLTNNTTNYSTSQPLLIDSGNTSIISPNIADGIIPSNATITSAKLWYYAHTYYDSGTVDLYLLKRNWVEAEVTWDIWSTGNNWDSGGAVGANDRYAGAVDSVTVNATGWWSFDVIDSIQDWIDGVVPDLYGWIFLIGISSGHDLWSSKYATDTTLRPYLSITWNQ